MKFLAVKDDSRISPDRVAVNAGESLVLKCLSYDEEVQWFHNDRKTEAISIINTLVINPVTLNDVGYYYCYGSYENKRHFIARAKVQVYGMYCFQRYLNLFKYRLSRARHIIETACDLFLAR